MRAGLTRIACSLVACAGLFGQGFAGSTGVSREGGALVPGEEYPVYDRVVESKFLTSVTRLVVVERETTVRLHPDEPRPPTLRWFEDVRPFGGRLPADLVRDFIAKNQRPFRLEGRFSFGVEVRFVTAEGKPEPDVRWMPQLSRRGPTPVQETPSRRSSTIDRLAFSRAAFTLRGTQALVYVVNERPDGTGGGLLVWLEREGADSWRVRETEVVWVAHPEGMEESDRG